MQGRQLADFLVPYPAAIRPQQIEAHDGTLRRPPIIKCRRRAAVAAINVARAFASCQGWLHSRRFRAVQLANGIAVVVL